MEDNNAKTVEFLRARLLSERAVSKIARQKADELTKRVEDLEEELRIVSLERRRAEKTTGDILAILDDNGYTEISEVFDSSSEDDSPGNKLGGENTEVDEICANSKMNGSVAGASASETEVSPANGRSLSWKGRRSETNSSGKGKQSPMRWRKNSESIYFSSPRHRHGRSCRQIRRRELRSVVENQMTDSTQEHEAATSLEDDPRTGEEKPCTVDDSELRKESDPQKNMSLSCSENEGNDGMDMEKALEHQAQLIGNYEALEKAQTEWEEKFRDNNSCMQDPLDPGNHSDVTEESEEIKMRAPHCGVSVVSFVQHAGTVSEGTCSFVEESSKARPDSLLQPSQLNSGLTESREPGTRVPESAVQDSAFFDGTKLHLEKKGHCQTHNLSHESSHCEPDGNTPIPTARSNPKCSSFKEEALSDKNQVVPHEKANGCNEVLEALKLARLSLKQKMDALPPLPNAGSPQQKIVSSTISLRSKADSFARLESKSVRSQVPVPVGCPGLFRVPTDLSAQVISPSSRQTPCYTDTAITMTPRDWFVMEAPNSFCSSSGSRNGFGYDSLLASGHRPSTSPRYHTQRSFPTEELPASSACLLSRNATPNIAAGSSFRASSNHRADDWPLVTHQQPETGPRGYTHNMGFDPHPSLTPPPSFRQMFPSDISYQKSNLKTKEGFPTFYRNPIFRSVEEH